MEESEEKTKAGFIPTRESLLSRLKDSSENDSWREFFETYWRLIYNAARRAKLNDSEAQEVVQETMLALNRKIREFHYDPKRGSFRTWLLNLTRWKIIDQIRARQQQEDLQLKVRAQVESDIQEVWDKDWQVNIAEEALRRVQNRVNPRIVQAFSTCVIQRRGARETAKLLRMSVPAVYVANLRIKRLLKREVEKLERGEI